MVIALIGESCTGKSTIAKRIAALRPMTIYTGKDYLRLAKSEQEAAKKFTEMLADQAQESIFVISEKEQLRFLPKDALRVLVTAELSVISLRFADRMGGKLPPPVAALLERKHGMFDTQPCDLHLKSGEESPEEAAKTILRLAAQKANA